MAIQPLSPVYIHSIDLINSFIHPWSIPGPVSPPSYCLIQHADRHRHWNSNKIILKKNMLLLCATNINLVYLYIICCIYNEECLTLLKFWVSLLFSCQELYTQHRQHHQIITNKHPYPWQFCPACKALQAVSHPQTLTDFIKYLSN